ncbi:hypothetical protein [uncultured Helicobacter sp.]|uniref:hypothetical protein n=1 Tax=uncultured Helicobacter sp. TaxID=175537 RepID=UPI0025874A48|nr:hypothetical protein [uncultured Helicobacter sp.]
MKSRSNPKDQIDCHDSATAESRNDGVVDCHAGKSARNDKTACHNEPSPCHTERSEVSKKSKCGYFANAQYDNMDSSLHKNDNIGCIATKYPHLNISVRPLSKTSNIRTLALNGTKAKELFLKYCKMRGLVLDSLSPHKARTFAHNFAYNNDKNHKLDSTPLQIHFLPSTSPANARYSFAKLLESWRIIAD